MSALNEMSTGKIINIIASDLGKLYGGLFVPHLFVIPFVIIYTFIFLW